MTEERRRSVDFTIQVIYNKNMIEKIRAQDYIKPSKFVTLHPGTTELVLLSDIYLYTKSVLRFGGKILSHIDDGSPLPLAFTIPNKVTGELPKYETKQKWAWIAYTLTDKRFGILEQGPMLGDQLANMCKGEPSYKTKVIEITREGEKLKTKYSARFVGDVEVGEDGKPLWWDQDKFLKVKKGLEGV